MGRINNRIFALAALSLGLTTAQGLAASRDDAAGPSAMVAGTVTGPDGAASGTAAGLIPDQRTAAALDRSLGQSGIILPKGGVQAACSGFSSLHRCLAALHIAKNIKVDGGFEPVREMLLYDDQASIADAARAFAPDVDPIAAEKVAHEQANNDLRKAGLSR